MPRWHRLFRLVATFACLMLVANGQVAEASPGAHEQAAEAALPVALAKLASTDTDERQAGIALLSLAGDATAAGVLDALRQGELGFDEDGVAWIQARGEQLHRADRSTGTPHGQLRLLRPDNNDRRQIDEAFDRIRLKSTSALERRNAASAIAKQPDPVSVAVMRQLIAREPDKVAHSSMALAIAKLDIQSPDAQLRIEAARVLGQSSDISMREQLEGLLRVGPNGQPREPDPNVRKAVSAAAAAIAWQELRIRTLANLIYGLSLGSVLLLAALGLAITFGLMKVINMAHGEMLMLGAYATFVSQSLFQRYAPAALGYYLVAAVPLAFVATAAVGLVLERLVVRRLYGRPLETLLSTWGLSLMLIQATRSIFGAQNVSVATPDWLSGGWELMPTVIVPYSRILVLGFTAVVVAFVWYVLQRTSLGLKLRAVTQNRDMAAALGINTTRIDSWTFALGSGVAGLGGVALSQLGNVGPELGQQHIIDSFMVVVLGGVGNVVGSIVGAMGLGIIAKFLEPTVGAVLGKIAILVVIILFIQWRPQGLFALKGRAQEN